MTGTRNKKDGLYDIPIKTPSENTDNYFIIPENFKNPKLHGVLQSRFNKQEKQPRLIGKKKTFFTKSTKNNINVMTHKKVENITRPYMNDCDSEELQQVSLISKKLNIFIRKDKTKSDLVSFLHGAMGSVVQSTWLKAIKNNQFTTWPGLTENLVKKHHAKSSKH